MTDQGSRSNDVQHLAGKYLTFQLGGEEYGIEILKVREIIGLMDIRTIPRTPEYTRGVINLRGRIIPVMELRLRFGMEPVPDTDETCIIVVDAEVGGGTAQMGILVDRVSEVLDIAADNLQPAPNFGGRVDSSFIRAMARREEKVTVLLGTEQILNVTELAAVIETAE